MVAACNQGLPHVRLATVLLANVLVLVRGGDAVRCGVGGALVGDRTGVWFRSYMSATNQIDMGINSTCASVAAFPQAACQSARIDQHGPARELVVARSPLVAGILGNAFISSLLSP